MDVHRLTVLAVRFGVPVEVVKRQVSAENGAPLLALVPPQEYQRLQGKAYVSSAEIERFKVDYLTLGRAAEAIGMQPTSAKALLDRSLAPVCDPATLGIQLYRRRDVEAFLGRNNAHVSILADLREGAITGAETATNLVAPTEMEASGESDASIW